MHLGSWHLCTWAHGTYATKPPGTYAPRHLGSWLCLRRLGKIHLPGIRNGYNHCATYSNASKRHEHVHAPFPWQNATDNKKTSHPAGNLPAQQGVFFKGSELEIKAPPRNLPPQKEDFQPNKKSSYPTRSVFFKALN